MKAYLQDRLVEAAHVSIHAAQVANSNISDPLCLPYGSSDLLDMSLEQFEFSLQIPGTPGLREPMGFL